MISYEGESLLQDLELLGHSDTLFVGHDEMGGSGIEPALLQVH